jgi:hypothetical protein
MKKRNGIVKCHTSAHFDPSINSRESNSVQAAKAALIASI